MKIKIELFELKNLLIEAATLGAEAAEKRRSPTSDRISQREVYRWLKGLGYRPSLLKKLEDSLKIKGDRDGGGKNSPLMYSRLEIEAALAAYKSFDSATTSSKSQLYSSQVYARKINAG